MPNLIEFLEARLAEDEAAARAAMGSLDEKWGINTGPYAIQRPTIETGGMGWKTASGEGIWGCDDPEDDCHNFRKEDRAEAEHIVRHEPARVLREVTAKRAIIAQRESLTPKLTEYSLDRSKQHLIGFIVHTALALDTVIKHLASAYSDHPDYRTEWVSEEA